MDTDEVVIVQKVENTIKVATPYADFHYDATFASDAETLAGTEALKAVTPAGLASIVDVEGGIAGKDAVDDALALKADADDVTDALALKADITDVEDALALKADADDVTDALALKAPLASPTFTGDVIVPDQTAGNNSTKAANTKYVDAKVSDAIANGVTGIAPSQNVVYDELLIKEQVDNLTYAGVDLTTKFATEIASHADVWAWIKARITAVNYAGLNIGDYIPFTLGASETIWAQIAGIDTYYRTGDTAIGHHIDFISKDCMATTYQWNTTDTNNGTAVNFSPWMVSALKASLDGLVTSLPAGLQAQVIEKRALLETRYVSGSTLTNSNNWAWNNMGKLWVPSEYEVVGTNIMTTPKYSSGSGQYPIFANNYKSLIKGAGHNGARSDWWSSSVLGGSSTLCCRINSAGTPSDNLATTLRRVPLCFRIG